MSSRPRLFDDVTRLAGDAVSALGGLREEAETAVKQRVERILADMDMVPREEFEAVRAMAIAAREEQNRLEARIATLEAQLGAQAAPAKPTAKPARKKAAPKAKATTAKAAKAEPDTAAD